MINNNMDSIFKIKQDVRSRRISSYDRSGGNSDRISIESGKTEIIADIEGSGIIKHVWFTMASEDPMIRKNAILRIYWDNEEHPSVESPIGEFFGQGWGEFYIMSSLPIIASPRGGRAMNCYFPMPYSKRALITVENQSDVNIRAFYFYIDYEIHEHIGEDCGRFHSQWNRRVTYSVDNDEVENGKINTTGDNNYVFADIEGKGHFVGINYYIDNPSPVWYGEGDDLWLIDGENWPGSMHGTGTEDFFNTSWCPNDIFQHPYFGCPRIANKYGFLGRTHYYRFFLEDPVYFNKSLIASIEHGHANAFTMDLASTVYWYQTEPHKVFPPLLDKKLRKNMPDIGMSDVFKWRKAWRNMNGGGNLWGNE